MAEDLESLFGIRNFQVENGWSVYQEPKYSTEIFKSFVLFLRTNATKH